MSATNRGGERAAFDYYETPPWVVTSLLGEPGARVPRGPSMTYLEAGAGNGNIISAFLDSGIRPDQWTAVEIQRRFQKPLSDLIGESRVVIQDFLLFAEESVAMGRRWDVVVMNPPYSKAAEFFRTARKVSRVVVMLGRLNWLGSRARNALIRGDTPDTFVIAPRPSFVGKGSDATEYSWFVWPTEAPRKSGIIKVLNAHQGRR